jgi:hypothetical protein
MPNSELVQAPSEEICFADASVLLELLRTKEVSAVEMMKAHLNQIARVKPKLNAIVTLVDEQQLLKKARLADDARAKGERLGPLHGLPVAVKDLHNEGNTNNIRFAFVPGRRSWNRLPLGPTRKEGRRNRDWKDKRAGVRTRVPNI